MRRKLLLLLAIVGMLLAVTGCYQSTEGSVRLEEGRVVRVFSIGTSPDDRILHLQLDSGVNLSYLGSLPVHLNGRYTFEVDPSAGYLYPFVLSLEVNND